MTRQGILILDNSCYARLVKSAAMRRLKANMRAAWLDPAASEVNLLEASATTPSAVEARLIAAIRNFAGDSPLLEWPFRLLKRLARAHVNREPVVKTGDSGKEWYLDDPAARAALRDEIRAFNTNLERAFSELHQKTRSNSQRLLKAGGVKREAADLRPFLDDEWPGLELRDHVARLTWQAFDLPGEAPIEALLRIPAWRILLDAEGAALYLRAMACAQPSFVQRADLAQLVYLGAAGQPILATADHPFLALGQQLINGRYPGARVVHIDTMLE